jgi:hypothetical protein
LTAHEALISLVWLVAASYAAYVTWFAVQTVRGRFREDHADASDQFEPFP